MTRPVRSRDDLSEGAANVGYEVHMCCEQSARLMDQVVQAALHPLDEVDTTLMNAWIEAHLLHARCITEFLVRPLPRQSGAMDMIRRDFAPDVPDWTPSPGASAAWLNDHWQDFNRHLAHLSWHRGVSGPPWDYQRGAGDVLAVAQAWCTFAETHTGTEAMFRMRAQMLWGRQALAKAPAKWDALTPEQKASVS